MRSQNILIKVETPWWQVVRGWTGRASPRLRDPYELSTERGERKSIEGDAVQARGERKREKKENRKPSGMKKNNLENRFGKTWEIFIMHVRKNSCARHGERERRFHAHSSLFQVSSYGDTITRKHLGLALTSPTGKNFPSLSRYSRLTRSNFSVTNLGIHFIAQFPSSCCQSTLYIYIVSPPSRETFERKRGISIEKDPYRAALNT